MRRQAALILLVVLACLTGRDAGAQLPDAAPSSRSALPGAAATGNSVAGPTGVPGRTDPGRGGPGAVPPAPGSGFSAFPDAATGQNGAASALPGAARGATPTPRGESGSGGSPAAPGGAAPTVPLIGAGNFCAQPAGLCGPACSISCREGRIAYCSGGQGGPTSPTGAGSCVSPPTCRCR
ncbi:hypothetical protein [Roseomonas sp. WA12]